jgi:hypothetical protein
MRANANHPISLSLGAGFVLSNVASQAFMSVVRLLLVT